MTFQKLHESLRLEMVRRIEEGTLTGVAIANKAGFRQAHISNFLNRKRALSLNGLDRVLCSQNLSIHHIMRVELQASSALGSEEESMSMIPVVSSSTAMGDAAIRQESVIETIYFSASRLQDCLPSPSPRVAGWDRFVAVRAEAEQAAAMEPMVELGSTLVLDRHYTSLEPRRISQRTLYAIRGGGSLMLRFVDFDDDRLILRPLSPTVPARLLAPAAHETPADYIVGRVCLIISQL